MRELRRAARELARVVSKKALQDRCETRIVVVCSVKKKLCVKQTQLKREVLRPRVERLSTGSIPPASSFMVRRDEIDRDEFEREWRIL